MSKIIEEVVAGVVVEVGVEAEVCTEFTIQMVTFWVIRVIRVITGTPPLYIQT